MATIDLTETLDRIVLIEKEALAALTPSVTADAVPRFFHVQESFPYWTNRIVNQTVTSDSEEMDDDNFTLIARLIIGHITSGYKGQPENNLYTYISQFKTYLNAREGLQTEQTSGPDLSDWQRYLLRARVVSATGLRAFDNAGIQALQVGTEFNILCQFNEDNTAAFT